MPATFNALTMKRIALLYTGGTIGCHGEPLTPMPGSEFADLLSSLPPFAGERLAEHGVELSLDWLETPLDSSDMAPADWVRIARRLLARYDEHEGFVVLHGTDTMSWSASALSFLLEGLDRPVVFTGSQLPLGHLRGDGVQNIVEAVMFASTLPLCEVAISFGHRLLRANRAVKVDSREFAAFESPNYPLLGSAGMELRFRPELLLPLPEPDQRLSLPEQAARLSRRLEAMEEALAGFSVVALSLFPGIGGSMVEALSALQPPLRGVVLEAFGAGNAPCRAGFAEALGRLAASGVVIVDATRVLSGGVAGKTYETGVALQRHARSVALNDLTVEASLAKLAVLLAAAEVDGRERAWVRQMMAHPVAGEMGR